VPFGTSAPQISKLPKIDFYLGERNEAEIPKSMALPISNDFDPNDEWAEYAEKMGLVNGAMLRELDKFTCYFTVGKGKGKRRTVKGWRQSWSNWVDKATSKGV
jgi:hypothetical protein